MRRILCALLPLAALFGLFGSGCDSLTSSSSSSTSTLDGTSAPVYPTSLIIEGSYFLGDVPCSTADGAMQSYVVTLTDQTPNMPVLVLPSSPPASCSDKVTFLQVVAGNTYAIEIDGYDIPASELVPFGGLSSGSRDMRRRDAPNMGTVAPRWTTTCDPVVQVDQRSFADECKKLEALAASTGILVDPRAALVGLACKSTKVDGNGNSVTVGDIASFNVRPDDPSLPALLNIPCSADGPAPSAFMTGISAGQTYSFHVEARAEASGPVVWGAACTALAVEGAVITAACEPLGEDGALDISLADLLGPSVSCSPDSVEVYDVNLVGPTPLSALAVPCDKPVRFSPLAPGSYAATIAGKDQQGNVTLKASCSGSVEPGVVTAGACQVL